MAYRLPGNKALVEQALAAHGPLRHAQPVPPESIAEWEGLLPELLLDFWENQGIGELGGGRMRLCLPQMFAEPLALLFHDDPDFAQGTVALAYGPFGSLILWNRREWLGLLTHPGAMLDAPFFGRSKAGLDPNRVVFDHVLNADPAFMDVIGEDGQDLFLHAQAQLGPLLPGQIYAPLPPGDLYQTRLDAMHRLDVQDWLSARFAGQVHMLHDLMGDRLNIRALGRGAGR